MTRQENGGRTLLELYFDFFILAAFQFKFVIIIILCIRLKLAYFVFVLCTFPSLNEGEEKQWCSVGA